MKYPKVSEMLKRQRKLREATIYDLAELVDVTASYLSQVENGNKIPSKTVAFKIAHFLNVHTDTNFDKEFLEEYASIKNLSFNTLFKEYEIWKEEYFENLFKPLRDLTESVSSNKIQVKKNTLEIKKMEEPYFDLNWLLNQKEYEVLYHRDYDIQGVNKHKGLDFRDRVLYNRLKEEDIKTINDLVLAYISNKYDKH